MAKIMPSNVTRSVYEGIGDILKTLRLLTNSKTVNETRELFSSKKLLSTWPGSFGCVKLVWTQEIGKSAISVDSDNCLRE